MTPRQALAELRLADKRRKQRLLEHYSLMRAAQHADKRADEKVRKALADE